MSDIKFVAMECPRCGANLEVKPDMNLFYCSYCGAKVQTVRVGGTLSLEELSEKVSKIENVSERAAAELALIRLPNELRELRDEILRVRGTKQTFVDEDGKSFYFYVPIVRNFYTSAELYKKIYIFGALFLTFGFVISSGLVLLLTLITVAILHSTLVHLSDEKLRSAREANLYVNKVNSEIDIKIKGLYDREKFLESQVIKNRKIVENYDSIVEGVRIFV